MSLSQNSEHNQNRTLHHYLVDSPKRHLTIILIFIVLVAVVAVGNYWLGFLLFLTGIVFVLIFLMKELQKTNRLLQDQIRQTERAISATNAKSIFLANVSHEIRTPMNAVIGMAELALREHLPPAAYEHVFTIKQSGQALLAIVNDILDLSKIESGKLEIIPGNYLFSSLINDVINIIRVKTHDTQVQFVVDISNEIPNALWGDKIRIRQILLNILGNAVKFTKKGYVSLIITSELNGEDIVNLTIRITDTGRGIKQEDIGKLFGDFVQVDHSGNTGIEGTGLGLAIARSLARIMDGAITVSSQYGVGSTFIITLPQKIREHGTLAIVTNPEEKRVLIYELRALYVASIVSAIDNLGVQHTLVSNDSEFHNEMSSGTYPFVFIAPPCFENVKKICLDFGAASTIVLISEFGETIAGKNITVLAMPVYPTSIANILNGTSGNFSYGNTGSTARFTAPGVSILVVDDIYTNLQVAEGLLRPYKMRVKLCKSGKEAIDALSNRKYDLVFMDHMMPEMDGIETTSRIRTLNTNDPYFINLPIIALTANAIAGTKEMCLANGFNDFLSKPIDTIQLNTVLEKWIPKEKQKKPVIETGSDWILQTRNSDHDLTIEGLDIGKGITLSGGTVENYKRTLVMFYRDGIEKTNQIRECLETDNLPQYIIHVHALKSAAANIGAEELSEIAKTLETAGTQKDRTFIQTHNPNLLSVLQSLLGAIEVVLKPNEEGVQADAAGITLLKTELGKLAEAIDGMNLRAIKAAIKNIQPFTQMANIRNDVEKILQNTLIGRYDETILLIKKFGVHYENTIDTIRSSQQKCSD